MKDRGNGCKMPTRQQYEAAFQSAAARYGIDWSIGYRQIQQESGFRCVTSHAGAKGPAQFMPGTWAVYGKGDPCDPLAASDAWGRYMSKLLRQFGGRYDLALAGYNSGENRAEYRNAFAQKRSINWAALPAGVQSETRNYVQRILGTDTIASAPAPAPAPKVTAGQGAAGQRVPAPGSDGGSGTGFEAPPLPGADADSDKMLPLIIIVAAVTAALIFMG